MKKVLFSLMAMLLLLVSGIAQTTYTKITSASGLEVGANYLIVAQHDDYGTLAMGYQKSNNRHAIVVSESGDAITLTPGTDPSSDTDVFEFTLGGSANAWTFFDEVKGGYLYAASSTANHLKTQTTLDANGQWSITFNNDGTAEVIAQGDNTHNNMRFNPNNGTPLFSCYAGSTNIDTRVSFYKAGGAPVPPVPAPSNYPTNFTSYPDGVDVILTWEDATGGQLPHGYLIRGTTTEIEVPQNGIIYNDELDQYVDYGQEIWIFRGLQPNTTYHFAIFPYTNSGADILYKTDEPYPKTTVTTEEVYELLYEDFNTEDLGLFNPISTYGEQVWHQGEYQGTTYANMNGYSGGPQSNVDWLISPAIEIGVDEWGEITFEFRTAKKYDGPEDDFLVKISMDYDGHSEEPGEFDWEDITEAFALSPGNYEWVWSGQYSIVDPEPGRYYLAFVYTSTTEAAASWEIDYVKVTGQHMTAVNENEAMTVSLYPNPARDQVSFTLESDAQVSVFDMMGRMVSEMNVAAGNAQLNVSQLENGVYFVNVRYANGSTAVSKFVKF